MAQVEGPMSLLFLTPVHDKYMKFLVLFFTVTVGLFQSSVAMAAEGLVTCTGGDDCNFCSFVDMTNGLIEWLIIIATLLTVLLLAFSGFRLVTSGGDAAALEQAKKIFVSSIIGIMIILAGWTIVDTALKVAAGGDLGVWNAIECGGAYEVTPADALNIVLEDHEGVTFESSEGDEQPPGFYFRAYSLNSADNCKQLSTFNFPDLEMCRSALSDVTSSGQSYVVQICGSGVSVSNTPSWSTLPSCGVSSVVVDGLTVNNDMQPIFDSAQGGSSMVRPGADAKMQAMLSGPFARLQQAFGPIVINDAIAKAGTSRERETTGSRHFHGDALDLSTAGMSNGDKIRLYEEARRAGFTGFGFGNTILHVDLGPRRGWSYNNNSYGGRDVQQLINSTTN
jgi:hypothetical protein